MNLLHILKNMHSKSTDENSGRNTEFHAGEKIFRHKLSRKSIKEAFDHLPSGVCFFDQDGSLVLCNITMHNIAHSLLNHSLQYLGELEKAIESAVTASPNICLLNGVSWKFTWNEVCDSTRQWYTEIIATDVTALVLRKKELELRNQMLKDAQLQLQNLSANVIKATREEELLYMKMRVHDTMGRSLISARRILLEKQPLENTTSIINEWESAVKLLQGAVRQVEYTDALDELRQAANGLIEIELSGNLPAQKDIAYLIVSGVRECATNAVRYAKATKLFVDIKTQDDDNETYITCSITNNGDIPTPGTQIKEGGGLSSLRKHIEQSGGSMAIQQNPCFSLNLHLHYTKESI